MEDYLRLIWNPQWFIVIGLIITLLGIIYSSGNYLDKKYSSLRLITQALTFGIFGAFINLLNDFLFTLIQKDILHVNNTAIPLGLTIGFAVFIVYNLAKRLGQNKILFIIIICVSVLVNAYISYISIFNPYAIYLSYSLAYISSFIIGMFTASLNISFWKKNAFGFLIICLAIALLIVLYHFLKVAEAGIITHEYIYTIGFIIGNTLYDAERVHVKAQIQVWISFIVWLLVGCLASLIILLPNFLFNKEVALLIYFFCISNAGGRFIIQQIKIRYKYINVPNKGQPLINWERLIYSLLVTILYTIPLLLIFNLDLYVSDSYMFEFDYILLGIASFSIIFIIIPLIYGFGNTIIYKIENLSEHRLGQIGLILAISGLFITTFLPH